MGKTKKEFTVLGNIFHIFEGLSGYYIKEGKAESGRKNPTIFFDKDYKKIKK